MKLTNLFYNKATKRAEIIFLPDIGTFFNNDIELAKSMALQLKKDGALFIKSEILHDKNIARDCSTTEKYIGSKGQIISENNRNLIERKVNKLIKYKKFFEFCKEIGLYIVVSVYDFKGAKFAKENGACALKIASSNITHYPLHKYVNSLNLPIIIDTGKSSFYEIARAVQWHEDCGNHKLIIEHSPAAPPTPLSHHHLYMLKTLKDTFGYPVGLSDHHYGEEMLFAAIALGASIIEKGIVPNGKKDDQDVYHALKIGKFKDILKKCKNIKEALGLNIRKIPDKAKKHPYRMGLIAKKNLKVGDILNKKTVSFAFPKSGIAVENWELVNAAVFNTKIKKNEPITWESIQMRK